MKIEGFDLMLGVISLQEDELDKGGKCALSANTRTKMGLNKSSQYLDTIP